MEKSKRGYLDLAIKLFRGFIYYNMFDQCGKYLRIGRGVIIIKHNSRLILGEKVHLYKNVKISAFGSTAKSVISIGNSTSIGDRTEIHAGMCVLIGSNCNIAWDCCILDRDYHKLNNNIETMKPVIIEDNVWIGCKSIILKGVHIGTGAVIAAGSIVTKDVPAHSLAAGNPAVVKKNNLTWAP